MAQSLHKQAQHKRQHLIQYRRGVAKIGDPLPYLFEWPGMVGPLPKLAECASGVGVINTAPEIDGVVRRVPLLMKIGEEVYPNMAIETIRVAVGDPSYQVKADECRYHCYESACLCYNQHRHKCSCLGTME